jgi:hypothetical protein
VLRTFTTPALTCGACSPTFTLLRAPLPQAAHRRVTANIKLLHSGGAEDALTKAIAADVLGAGKCVAGHPLGI